MPRKGTPNPNAGRPAGSPNKATIEFKEALTALLNEAAPDMVKWLGEIDDPFKRFDVLSKFAEFIHPKLARQELHTPEPLKVEHSISTKDQEILDRFLKGNK